MRGRGVAYGAATVVNAMPSGFGAALGVGLRTFAEVELADGNAVEVEIADDPAERKGLAEEAFRSTLKRFGLDCGGRIRTRSEIPVACGMKSSSAASNAVVLATLDAIGEQLCDLEVVNLGVDASLRAGVTLTGAFDDACASLLGMIHLTDNYRRKILKSYEVERHRVIFLVPDRKRYSGEVKREDVSPAKRLSEIAFKEASEGRYWQAALLNGLMMANVFGVDPSPILQAMKNGAVSAGLSGKGPAVFAVARVGEEGAIIDGWRGLGQRILETETNGKRARAGVVA